jgi:excisionase family DNA binding protein
MQTDNRGVLTVKELADYLRVHPATVYRHLKRGRLPAFRVGRDWRFDIEIIDRRRIERDGIDAAGENFRVDS